MLTLREIFAIIIIHWIADFVFQDEKWALGKSKNWSDLLKHTTTYTILWYILAFVLVYWFNGRTFDGTIWQAFKTEKNYKIFYFLPITFIAHTITDYFTSRIVSVKFKNKEYGSAIPNFGAFTIIGIDQVLHYMQLFTTYYLLK